MSWSFHPEKHNPSPIYFIVFLAMEIVRYGISNFFSSDKKFVKWIRVQKKNPVLKKHI
jgi:hypothetical protein